MKGKKKNKVNKVNKVNKEINEINSRKIEFKKYMGLYSKWFEECFILEKRDHYKPIIVSLKYSLLGITLKDHIISINNYNFDTRFSYIYSIKSGNGKKGIVNVIQDFADVMGLTYAKIVSLHEEQLIGKIKLEKEKDEKGKSTGQFIPVEIPGFFRREILVKDDALSLLNLKDNQGKRDYFIEAWDTIGYNLILKKLVDHTDSLQYFPTFVSYMFIQDKTVFQENIDTGISRKSPILYVNAPEANKESYTNRFRKSFFRNINFIKFINFFNVIYKIKTIKWDLPDESIEFLAEKSEELISSIKTIDKSIKEYSKIIQWVVQDNLLRFSAIVSAFYEINKNPQNNEYVIEITKETIEYAYADFKTILDSIIEHRLNYSVSRDKLDLLPVQKTILKELYRAKAYGEDKAVNTTKFIEKICEEYGVPSDTIKYNISGLKKKGLLQNKLSGRRKELTSKLWATEKIISWRDLQ
jgi:hypothetical protein